MCVWGGLSCACLLGSLPPAAGRCESALQPPGVQCAREHTAAPVVVGPVCFRGARTAAPAAAAAAPAAAILRTPHNSDQQMMVRLRLQLRLRLLPFRFLLAAARRPRPPPRRVPPALVGQLCKLGGRNAGVVVVDLGSWLQGVDGVGEAVSGEPERTGGKPPRTLVSHMQTATCTRDKDGGSSSSSRTLHLRW